MPENSLYPTLVTQEIIATDLDTTADLEFKIDWAQTYATKSGQEARKELYEKYFNRMFLIFKLFKKIFLF